MSYSPDTSGGTITVDYARVKEAAEQLKQNPPTEDEITADPKAFLEKHGITITDELNRKIMSGLSSSKPGAGDVAQAGLVHIDI